MILKRLAEAIHDQNWSTVVLEVLIVVVGIFIGLQVDDWNERRKDRLDAEAFVARMHDDVVSAKSGSDRVRERRLGTINDLVSAADVVFGRAARDALTEAECEAIGVARFFNIVISELPSLTELLGEGRLDIIEDTELRLAIINLQQRTDAIKALIPLNTIVRVDLPMTFPELIRATAYYHEAFGEQQQRYECDLDGMRNNQAFKNGLSLAIDGYDAYLRDGLVPWVEQIDLVHRLLDDRLGLDHMTE